MHTTTVAKRVKAIIYIMLTRKIKTGVFLEYLLVNCADVSPVDSFYTITCTREAKDTQYTFLYRCKEMLLLVCTYIHTHTLVPISHS